MYSCSCEYKPTADTGDKDNETSCGSNNTEINVINEPISTLYVGSVISSDKEEITSSETTIIEIENDTSTTEPTISLTENEIISSKETTTTEEITVPLTTISTTLLPTTEQPSTTEIIIIPQQTAEPEFKKNVFTIIHSDFMPSDYLIDNMNTVIKNDKFRTGFYLKALDGTIEMFCNPTYEYSYDSTIKGAVALYVYKEIVSGNVNLDTYIGNETIGALLDKMLYESDNNAYHSLRNYFSNNKINNFTSSLGCKTFKISNQWASETPKDAGILWEEIYKFCNNSGDIGELFMSQLINAKWNFVSDALGKYTIPHKYGYTSDVFAENSLILKDEGRSYIFTYYTSGSYDNNILSQVIIILDEIMQEYDTYTSNDYNN